MTFVLISLWSIAIIIWMSEPGSAVNRRLGALAFSGGIGALAAMLDLSWIELAAQAGAGENARLLLYRLQAFSSVFSYYGIPYFFLLFSLSYRGVKFKSRAGAALPWLLLIPAALCVWLTPPYNEMYPISFNVVVWWAVPYIVAGTALIVSKRVPPSVFARTHWIVCFAVLPPVLFCMMMNYVLPSLGMHRMWVYNTWIVGLGAFVFVIGLFTYGFMGMRIMIDRRRYDSALRAATSGTALLNHAIKNDAGKLRLFGEKIQGHALATGQDELLADARAILSASRHIEEMVRRVHRRTEDLELRPERVDLGVVLEDAIQTLEPYLGQIERSTSLIEGWSCVIDKAQVTEAFTNIVMNAIEAMEGGGRLDIALTEHKRELVVEIRDSGPGMDRKRRVNAFEPFYTTKRGGGNFGLGLPYAYHVMRKHKGSLYFRSKPGEGTTFYMSFLKRAVAAKFALKFGEQREERA